MFEFCSIVIEHHVRTGRVGFIAHVSSVTIYQRQMHLQENKAYCDTFFNILRRFKASQYSFATLGKSVSIFNVAIYRHFKKRHNFHHLGRFLMSFFVSFCNAFCVKIQICDAFSCHYLLFCANFLCQSIILRRF